MLYATKGSVTLHISILGGKVCINPEEDGDEHSRLPATIAHNEELLAQLELQTNSPIDPEQQLVHYFAAKGWRVEDRNAPSSECW